MGLLSCNRCAGRSWAIRSIPSLTDCVSFLLWSKARSASVRVNAESFVLDSVTSSASSNVSCVRGLESVTVGFLGLSSASLKTLVLSLGTIALVLRRPVLMWRLLATPAMRRKAHTTPYSLGGWLLAVSSPPATLLLGKKFAIWPPPLSFPWLS